MLSCTTTYTPPRTYMLQLSRYTLRTAKLNIITASTNHGAALPTAASADGAGCYMEDARWLRTMDAPRQKLMKERATVVATTTLGFVSAAASRPSCEDIYY